MKARDKQVGGEHYKSMPIEPWDVVDTWPLEQRIGYYRGGGLKYVMRMGTKDEAPQEIGKGKHYLEKLLEVLNERDTPERPSTISSQLRRASARLQEICANAKITQSELDEVTELSKLAVRASSIILVWAEGVVSDT
jgi:hypothetical protein